LPGRTLAPTIQIAGPYSRARRAEHPLFAGEVDRAQLLRRMVVLKEILEPPVAIRDRDVWDRM
jgi:hypothetical protein